MKDKIYNYTKKEIIKILYSSAEKYKKNLLDKNILFIYENKERKKISYIETIFNDYNFLHLTGIKYTRNAFKFFNDCLSHRLSPNNIQIKSLVFTKLKLEILENIMSINKSAKKIGTYNYNKENIKIEKVVGNNHCCLGFSNIINKNKIAKYYYPKTLLQEDFKNNIEREYRIIAIFAKNKKQKLYNEITYLSRKFDNKCLYDEWNKIIDWKNIYSDNTKYIEIIKNFK